MTTLLPALEDELLRTARRVLPAAAAAAPAPARRAIRPPRRRGAPLAVVLAAALTISGGAYAARGLWLPALGNDSYGYAEPTRDAPPADQLAIVGALRRDQAESDRSAAVRAVLASMGPDYGQVRTGYVRRLGTLPEGQVAVLVPVHQRPGFDPTYPELSPEQLYLGFYDPETGVVIPPTVPVDARGLRQGASLLGIDPRRTAAQRAREQAYLAAEARAGRLWRGRGTPARYGMMTAAQAHQVDALIGRKASDPALVVGLVPDGVDRVQVNDAAPVRVRNNLFVGRTIHAGGERLRWLDKHGDVVPFALPGQPAK